VVAIVERTRTGEKWWASIHLVYKDRGTYQSDDWYSLALGNVAETPVIKAVVKMEMKKRILGIRGVHGV